MRYFHPRIWIEDWLNHRALYPRIAGYPMMNRANVGEKNADENTKHLTKSVPGNFHSPSLARLGKRQLSNIHNVDSDYNLNRMYQLSNIHNVESGFGKMRKRQLGSIQNVDGDYNLKPAVLPIVRLRRVSIPFFGIKYQRSTPTDQIPNANNEESKDMGYEDAKSWNLPLFPNLKSKMSVVRLKRGHTPSKVSVVRLKREYTPNRMSVTRLRRGYTPMY